MSVIRTQVSYCYPFSRLVLRCRIATSSCFCDDSCSTLPGSSKALFRNEFCPRIPRSIRGSFYQGYRASSKGFARDLWHLRGSSETAEFMPEHADIFLDKAGSFLNLRPHCDTILHLLHCCQACRLQDCGVSLPACPVLNSTVCKHL